MLIPPAPSTRCNVCAQRPRLVAVRGPDRSPAPGGNQTSLGASNQLKVIKITSNTGMIPVKSEHWNTDRQNAGVSAVRRTASTVPGIKYCVSTRGRVQAYSVLVPHIDHASPLVLDDGTRHLSPRRPRPLTGTIVHCEIDRCVLVTCVGHA